MKNLVDKVMAQTLSVLKVSLDKMIKNDELDNYKLKDDIVININVNIG